MKAVTTIRSKSSGFIKSKAKKETKSTKSKSDTSQIVHPKIRMQMIEEAAYFKAMNRDFTDMSHLQGQILRQYVVTCQTTCKQQEDVN